MPLTWRRPEPTEPLAAQLVTVLEQRIQYLERELAAQRAEWRQAVAHERARAERAIDLCRTMHQRLAAVTGPDAGADEGPALGVMGESPLAGLQPVLTHPDWLQAGQVVGGDRG
jgi:hypothetical protein